MKCLKIIQYCNGQIFFGTIRNLTHVALLEVVAFNFPSARFNMASVQTVFTFLNMKECSMILESAKFKSTIKNPSI